MKIILLLYLTLFQNCEAKPKIGKLTELTVFSVENNAQVYKNGDPQDRFFVTGLMILIASIFNGSLLDVVGIGADSYEYFANGLEYYKLFLNETDFNDPFEILDAAAQDTVRFIHWTDMYVADLSSTLRDLNEDELNTDFDEISNPFEPVKGLAVELSIYFNLAKMIRYGWPKESVNNHLFYMFNLWTSFILDIIQNGYDEQKQLFDDLTNIVSGPIITAEDMVYVVSDIVSKIKKSLHLITRKIDQLFYQLEHGEVLWLSEKPLFNYFLAPVANLVAPISEYYTIMKPIFSRFAVNIIEVFQPILDSLRDIERYFGMTNTAFSVITFSIGIYDNYLGDETSDSTNTVP